MEMVKHRNLFVMDRKRTIPQGKQKQWRKKLRRGWSSTSQGEGVLSDINHEETNGFDKWKVIHGIIKQVQGQYINLKITG